MRGAHGKPVVEVYDHQSVHVLDSRIFARFARRILPTCLGKCLSGGVPLAALDAIEISLVDDGEIARVHGEFMDDPTPTDVISFDHGEILVSTETAGRQAPENGNSLEREIATYIAHGLLHLAGYRDQTPEEFEAMREEQEQIVAAAWQP